KPDTNVISDKNRIATSKSPHVDPKELKKILDSARAGRPGQGGQPAPPPQPQQQAQNAPPQPPQEQPEQAPPAPPPPTNTNQMAKLTTPPITPPKPSFNTAPMSAGSAIEQAARAALANRGAGYGSEGEGGLWARARAASYQGSRRVGCSQRHHGRGLRSLPVACASECAAELVQPDSRGGSRPDHEEGQSLDRVRHHERRIGAGVALCRQLGRCGARPRGLWWDYGVESVSAASGRVQRPVPGVTLPLLLQPGPDGPAVAPSEISILTQSTIRAILCRSDRPESCWLPRSSGVPFLVKNPSSRCG